MADSRHFLGPDSRSSAGPQLLPGEMLEQGVRRLSVLTAFVAVVTLGLLIVLLLAGNDFGGSRGGVGRPTLVVAVLSVISWFSFVLLRRRSIPIARRLAIGTAWYVLAAFGAGLFRHWIPYSSGEILRGPSPVIVFIILFAVLMPMHPRRMVVTGLAAAITDPLALWMTTLLGNPWPESSLIVWLVLPGFGAVVIAVIASRVIYSLGRSVEQARELGSYRLEERLGSGGMGEVWRAHHRLLARPAAVKLVKPEALGARDTDSAALMLRRFEREAQATAGLQSHHTIVLYDYGIANDGTFYYVMELLSGMSLHDLVGTHGPVPPERAAFILRQICHSLDDAHHAGVIHRDVKPANIFICRKGLERDFVKVLDFGLVRFHAEGDVDGSRLTADGALAGTPAYMAPEIASGDGDVDTRADIYSVGCVAYFMLTGNDVFDGKNAMQIILAHVQKPIPELPDVPAPLAALITRCLAKHPDERPQSIAAVAAALDDTKLASAWTAERATAWWDRHGPADTTAATTQPTHEESRFVLADTMLDDPIDTSVGR